MKTCLLGLRNFLGQITLTDPTWIDTKDTIMNMSTGTTIKKVITKSNQYPSSITTVNTLSMNTLSMNITLIIVLMSLTMDISSQLLLRTSSEVRNPKRAPLISGTSKEEVPTITHLIMSRRKYMSTNSCSLIRKLAKSMAV